MKNIASKTKVSIAEGARQLEWSQYVNTFNTPRHFTCFLCGIPVGIKGTSPAIQIGERDNKKYKHITCGGPQ